MRTGRCFGVILHTEAVEIPELQPLNGTVIQVDVRYFSHIRIYRLGQYGKSVILRCNLNETCFFRFEQGDWRRGVPRTFYQR